MCRVHVFFLFHSINSNSKVIQFKSYRIKSIPFFQITTNQSKFFCVYIFITPFVFLCLLPLCISQVSMIQSLVNFVFLCFPLWFYQSLVHFVFLCFSLCISEISLILSLLVCFVFLCLFPLCISQVSMIQSPEPAAPNGNGWRPVPGATRATDGL